MKRKTDPSIPTLPRITTLAELTKFLRELEQHPQVGGYNTGPVLMALAGEASFRWMAHLAGSTGFQASWASLELLRRLNGYKGPFMVIDGNRMLYPQYCLKTELAEFLERSRPWAATEAKKLLKDRAFAHPDVVAHWKQLAKFKP